MLLPGASSERRGACGRLHGRGIRDRFHGGTVEIQASRSRWKGDVSCAIRRRDAPAPGQAPATVQPRRHIPERIRDEAAGRSLGPMELSRYRNRETTATNGRKRAAVEIRERRRGGFFASPVRGSPSASARDRPEWKDLLSSPGKLVGPFCRNYSPGNQWWRVGASREIPSEVSPPGRTFETCR